MSVRRAAAAALATLALAMPTSVQAVDLVIGMTPSTFSLPIDVAEAQGHFNLEGVTVRLVDCSSGPRCMQLMLDGSVDVAFSSELPVVFSSFKRADYAILATVATSTRNIKLVGRRSAGIAKPSQLEGKRIGVMVGTSAHYFLDAYLLFHGIDPKRVKIVALSPEEMPEAMKRKDIDVLAGYSRHSAPAAKVLGADAIEFEAPHLYTDSYNFIVLRDTISRREESLVRALRAIERAERFIADQPKAAKEVMQARARIDGAFADAIFPGYTYRLGLGHSLVSTMEGEARWATREGHVPAESRIPNYLDYVDDAPLRKAVPGAAAR